MADNAFTHVPTDIETLSKIRSSLPSYITGKRLEHTYSVEKEALAISEILFPLFGIDKQYQRDLSAAALLHDITKYLSADTQNELCKEYGIEIDPYSESNTAVLHSKTAAHVAKRDFCINDFVFSAIFCHTTGKENMNLLEKIIFIADYIEITRTHTSCIEARKYFYDSIGKGENALDTLNKTIIMSIDSTLAFLIEKGVVIDSQTIKARNFLLAEYALQRSIQR